MNLAAIICDFKGIVYPVMGTLITLFLVSFIPGIMENKNDYNQ